MSIVQLTAIELCPGPHTPLEQDHSTFDDLLWDLCERVLHNLGRNQSENTYQRCLGIELRHAGIMVDTEVSIQLLYKGHIIGSRRADMVLTLPAKFGVQSNVIIELKSLSKLNEDHERQLKYYMKYMDIGVGYLLNFPHNSNRFPDVDLQTTKHFIHAREEAAPQETTAGGGAPKPRQAPTHLKAKAAHAQGIQLIRFDRTV